jgi:hypothetical protein
MKRMLTVIVCLVCCLVAPVVQAGEKKPMSDPSGTWRWNFEINGNTIDNVLKVNTDKDGKLTGALEAHGLKMDVQEGKVTGDEVSFQIEAQLDQKITVRFLGKIEGDKINGNLTAKGDGEAREFPWTATRLRWTRNRSGRQCSVVDNGPLKIVAMADVFQKNLDASHGNLSKDTAKAANWTCHRNDASSASMLTSRPWMF